MADEWWSSASARRTGTGDASSAACSTTVPAKGSVTSRTASMSLLQPGFPDDAAAAAASSSSSSFLADPLLDWTMQAFMGGRVAAAAAEGGTSFNALLQLQGDACHHQHQFLLDQAEEAAAPDPVLAAAPYGADDGAVLAASSQHGVTSLYADSQYGSGLGSSSYGDVPAAAATTTKKPFSQPARLQLGQQQQYPGFFSSPGLFGAPDPGSPQLLLQALEHKHLKLNTELIQDACSSSVTRRSAPGSPAAETKKPRIETPSPTFKVRAGRLSKTRRLASFTIF